MRIINPFYAARRKASSGYNVLDLFSGIGGFSLGLERAGMKTAAFCEIDPFCQRVLSRHWPKTRIYADIKQLNSRRLHHDGLSIDILCGGYPCQPFSVAGQRRGEDDPRYLWPEMYRLIREIRPRWVICENVAGHIELGLDTVLSDLADAGYATTPVVVPACAVGAPHRRDRIWLVAHAIGFGPSRTQTARARQLPRELPAESVRWELPSPFTLGSDDGVPYRMERTQALGNAVVPQIPELIGRAIIAYESQAVADSESWALSA